MAIRLGDTAPDFEADTTQGKIRLPRMARGLVGRAVQPPQGFHPGVHHRARPGRGAEARVRQAQREGDRPLGRPGGVAREVGGRHRRDTGHRRQLPDDRRLRPRRVRPVRHDPPERQRHAHGTLRVRDRAGQEGQALDHLPGVAPAATSTRSSASSTRCSSPRSTRSRRRSTGRTATTSSSARRSPTRRQRRCSPQGWTTVKPYLRTLPQPGR